MTVPSKPIPALYVVYILRSSVRRASFYIGSTPHPPRRLKQHNGLVKGGATRTSRASLRPWEMVAVVSGFPSKIAALKFEWAFANPHLSLHIPSSSRITIATQKKRNGHPKRPPYSLTSIISNLHLLLRVPSFVRWPLKLHFFDRDVHNAWLKLCSTANEQLRSTMEIVTDFEPHAETRVAAENVDPGVEGEDEESAASPPVWGIHALPLDYAPMREIVTKTESIFSFEREGKCVVCNEHLPTGEGIYAACTNTGCEGVGHLSCWSGHLLGSGRTDEVLPIGGHCPKCKGPVTWGEMMTEMTLRMHGRKEVEKLLKAPRKKRAPAKATAKSAAK
ncbi:Structure-specific endonuclease subunit SLX1 [Apiospora kogelbergensis]|uniref:Structure-specific endonuclease subunit SLX1 n=1 Tax=Apiospora kogelbergensis TaxID=1337665 RepID=UPI0031305242